MQLEIRDALVGFLAPRLSSDHPTLAVVYDNGPFNWGAPPDLFAEICIDFTNGEQVGLALAPRRRVAGTVHVALHARTGTGSRKQLELIDWFSENLKFTRIGTVTLQSPVPEGSDNSVKGWSLESVRIPFVGDPG